MPEMRVRRPCPEGVATKFRLPKRIYVCGPTASVAMSSFVRSRGDHGNRPSLVRCEAVLVFTLANPDWSFRVPSVRGSQLHVQRYSLVGQPVRLPSPLRRG